MEADITHCLLTTSISESGKWHARLGHVNTETMKLMINKELVTGIPRITVEKETCVACLYGNQTRQSFPQSTSFRAKGPLELIHGDLCGPITPSTPEHKRYVFVLIDDCSRYMWTVLLKEKGEAFKKFKIFKTLAEQETGAKVKTLRTDRGGEFCSHEFKLYCDANGIDRHLTAPYSPQQNGVVERRNRTLMEMTRSILKHMSVPNWLWGEAVRHATYLINRIATRSLMGKTPYEALCCKKPSLTHLRTFGCVCYARTETAGRKKLDDRSRILVHLGTEPGSKAYRLLNPSSKRIIVNRDVVFDEEKAWNWEISNTNYDNNTGSITINVQSNEKEEEEQGMNDNEEVDEEEEGDDDGGIEEEQSQPRRSSRVSAKPSYLDDYILLADIECEKLLMVINNEPWD